MVVLDCLKMPPIAILALGGYGREALNPYSDIDIMLVYNPSELNVRQVEPFANQLITTLWDIGFEVGHSCRSLKECVRATYDDIFSKTSMLEARYIVGARQVYREFQRLTSKHFFKKQVGKFIAKTIEEWSTRHESYGANNLPSRTEHQGECWRPPRLSYRHLGRGSSIWGERP